MNSATNSPPDETRRDTAGTVAKRRDDARIIHVAAGDTVTAYRLTGLQTADYEIAALGVPHPEATPSTAVAEVVAARALPWSDSCWILKATGEAAPADTVRILNAHMAAWLPAIEEMWDRLTVRRAA